MSGYPESRGSIGLYDPETLVFCFGCSEFDETMRESVLSAFGSELLSVFANESANYGDEWSVRKDRFGRCLSQSEIIRVYQYA